MQKRLVAAIVLLPMLAGCMAQQPAPSRSAQETVHAGPVDVQGDAPAFLDALSGRFIEGPHNLTVEITLASFDEARLVEELGPLGSSAWIFMCWRQGDAIPPDWVRAAASVDKIVAPDTECAGVEMFVDETMHIIGQYISYHSAADGCNSAWFCAWRMPYEIEGGSPATLRVPIPREFIYNATLGAVLGSPHLETGIWPWDTSSISARIGRYTYACAGLDSTGLCPGTGATGSDNEILDTSEYGPDTSLTLETVPTYEYPDADLLILDAPRRATPSDPALSPSAESDVLSVDLDETGAEIAYRIHVASLGERPWHQLSMALGIADALYLLDYEVVAGEFSYIDGLSCLGDWECQRLPASVSFEPGAPGTIRVAFDCADLERAAQGDLVTWAEMWIRGSNAYRQTDQPTPAGDVWLEGGSGDSVLDPVFPGEPYRLRQGC